MTTLEEQGLEPVEASIAEKGPAQAQAEREQMDAQAAASYARIAVVRA